MIVEVVLSERHTVLDPQQKSEGKPLPHCERSESPPQVFAARFVRVKSSGTQYEASFSNSFGIHRARADATRRMQGSAKRVVKVNMIRIVSAEKSRGYLNAGIQVDVYKRDKERQQAGQRSQATETEEER